MLNHAPTITLCFRDPTVKGGHKASPEVFKGYRLISDLFHIGYFCQKADYVHCKELGLTPMSRKCYIIAQNQKKGIFYATSWFLDRGSSRINVSSNGKDLFESEKKSN